MLEGKLKEKRTNGWRRVVRKEIADIRPYIPGKPIHEVKSEYSLDRVIKLASNENPLGVSEKVKEAISGECEKVNRYPDGYSYSLRHMVAKKLAVDEEMLIFGNGSDGLLKVIAEVFLERDSKVIISYPTFVEYSFVSKLMGSKLVRVWMDNYHQNLKGIGDAITSKTRLIFLTNPHNPTGTVFSDDEFRKLLEELPDDVVVVLDEAYKEYVDNDNYPDALKYIRAGYPVIALRTFSKAYGLAGLRLGYAIARPEIIKVLAKARDPFNVNHLAETAAKAVLQDEEYLIRTLENNKQGKEYLYRELEKLGLSYVPTEANFILIKVDGNSVELFKKLLMRGIIIRPGKPLGYINHIRLSIGLPEENKAFIDELSRINFLK